VRIQRSSVGGRIARTTRLLIVIGGVVAACAYALPAADAIPAKHSGAPQLSAVSAAVARSGVDGIAWYTDTAAGKVVVTADSTVSAAEVAAVKRSAGASADAIAVKHTSGVFRLRSGCCCRAVPPSTAVGTGVRWVSTSSEAAPTTSSPRDTAAR
jgi:streptogrisin B